MYVSMQQDITHILGDLFADMSGALDTFTSCKEDQGNEQCPVEAKTYETIGSTLTPHI